MTNKNLVIVLRLLLLLAIDILVVSRLEIGIYFVPHIYLLSLLMLPVRTKKSWLLLFGFFSGLIVDIFMNTGGLHAAACTMMAFVRIFILRFFLAPEDEDNNISPGLFTLGYRKYLIYSSVLILAHQLTFFALEVFKTDSFFLILKKTVASTILNLLLVLFIQMLFMKPAKKKNERRKR
jgi:rod shape-determining protein MreD